MNFSNVWTEKYRPQNISELILDEENKKYFSELTTIPNNFLFIGTPGIGKTTLAKILAKKFSPNSYIYINASEQGNIDTVRNLISDFISVASIDGNEKIVILDESDGISYAAQSALRSVMEEYLGSTKFILTANYKNKLSEPIRSRCQEFNFSLSGPQILQRIVVILKSEKIQVSKDCLDDIRNIVQKFYPDVRKTINELQKCCQTGIFVKKHDSENPFFLELKKSISSSENIFDIRKKIIENTALFNNDYHFLMRQLFNLYIEEKNSNAVLTISEYMYRHSNVVDPEVNFTALIFNLRNSMKNNK